LVPLDSTEFEPETELAWRLVTERWLGSLSDFAPYLDFLWSVDLNRHPVFWENEEVAWLQASVKAHEEVLDMRERTAARIRALVGRASKQGSRVPAQLLADAARLEAELRSALVLVEARAMEVESALGEPSCAAMVPLVDHLEHDPTDQPSMEVGDCSDAEGWPMRAVARAALPAGTELRHCYEPIGSAQLLARYGCVPEAKGSSQEEQLRANAFGSVALPVRISLETFQEARDRLPAKLRLLAERAGLDLRRGAPAAAARLALPRDLHLGGRMLPAARFLTAVIGDTEGGGTAAATEAEEAASCAALFEELFMEASGPPPPPLQSKELTSEVSARAIAWEWCERLLKRYQKAFDGISSEVGLSTPESAGANQGSEGLNAGLEALVDTVVLAHYKARGAEQQSRKSRKPQEARLLAVSGSHATVQFLSNGVRQSIPAEWISQDAAKRPQKASPTSTLRAERGRLVLSLLQTEAALIEVAYSWTQNVVQLGTQILQARQRGRVQDDFELTSYLKLEWEKEQQQARQAAEDARDALED